MIEFILCVVVGGWLLLLALGLIGDLFGRKERKRRGNHWPAIQRACQETFERRQRRK